VQIQEHAGIVEDVRSNNVSYVISLQSTGLLFSNEPRYLPGSVFGGLVKDQGERLRFSQVQIKWNTRHKRTSRCWYK